MFFLLSHKILLLVGSGPSVLFRLVALLYFLPILLNLLNLLIILLALAFLVAGRADAATDIAGLPTFHRKQSQFLVTCALGCKRKHSLGFYHYNYAQHVSLLFARHSHIFKLPLCSSDGSESGH